MSETKTVSLNLKSLIVPSKSMTAEYPGLNGFEININYLSRETLQSLRKKATTSKFKGRGAESVDEVNEDLFLSLYVKAVVTGWKGFKLAYLEQLVPVDIEGQDKQAELPYNEENALFLMKNSSDFDAWVSSIVSDLGKFVSSKESK